MEIRQYTHPVELPNLAEDILGFDLEMANSFRNSLPVICMIGTEFYEAGQARCVTTIASITRREEEPELIAWFLDHLGKFRALHDSPKLATFSGTDNDIPWVEERIARYGIAAGKASALASFENLDLRAVFHQRTQNDRISLKKMEELFGIERESSLSSRKVSFMLTDVLTRNGDGAEIPEQIYGYLEDDVHHLLLILNRWNDEALTGYFLTEFEYLNRIVGLLKHCRRLVAAPPSRFPAPFKPPLGQFAERLGTELNDAIVREDFERFELPPLPELPARHNEGDRVKRRYGTLASIQVWDRKRKQYRLGRQLNKPKGTLALVRNQDKVLMIRRAEHIERAPGFWGLPGGVMEKGELPETGALRELLEEVNLEGRALGLLGTQPSMNRVYELFWVEVEVSDFSTLNPNMDEVAEARWVTPEEFLALDPLIPGAVEGFRAFLGSKWGRHESRGKSRRGGATRGRGGR